MSWMGEWDRKIVKIVKRYRLLWGVSLFLYRDRSRFYEEPWGSLQIKIGRSVDFQDTNVLKEVPDER